MESDIRGSWATGSSSAYSASCGLNLTVLSSRYGVPAYEKLGFRQTGPERAVNEIACIPMAMRLATEDTVIR